MINPKAIDEAYVLGHSFDGVQAIHCKAEFLQLDALICEHKPKRILEFGTCAGALTLMLGAWAKMSNALVFTNDLFDVTSLETKIKLAYLPVIIGRANELTPRELLSLSEFLDTDEKLFVYCDGGHKAQELRQVSRMLKSGDVIACHDFERSDEEDKPFEGINKESERVYEHDIKPLLENGFTRLIDVNEHKKGMHVMALLKE